MKKSKQNQVDVAPSKVSGNSVTNANIGTSTIINSTLLPDPNARYNLGGRRSGKTDMYFNQAAIDFWKKISGNWVTFKKGDWALYKGEVIVEILGDTIDGDISVKYIEPLEDSENMRVAFASKQDLVIIPKNSKLKTVKVLFTKPTK